MSKWQFDVMFVVFIAGAVFLMFAKSVFRLEIDPVALSGYGALTTYVLTQRNQWTKKKENGDEKAEADDGPH